MVNFILLFYLWTDENVKPQMEFDLFERMGKRGQGGEGRRTEF
jgi:hypothetical protein